MGAWDANFRAALSRFQSSAGVTADGWIGPQSRAALKRAIALANAGAAPPAPTPDNPIPHKPASDPTTPPDEGLSTGAKVAIGAGIVAAVAGGAYYLSR